MSLDVGPSPRGDKGDPVAGPGTFRLKPKLLFIANALKQHHIGLDETDDGIWSIYFGAVLLGKVDERDMIIRD